MLSKFGVNPKDPAAAAWDARWLNRVSSDSSEHRVPLGTASCGRPRLALICAPGALSAPSRSAGVPRPTGGGHRAHGRVLGRRNGRLATTTIGKNRRRP